MNRHYRSYPRMPGFTLVEILVALTLFSLVLAMIFSGLHSSAKSWEKGEAQISKNDTRRLDLGFVRKQLTQAIPLLLIDGKDNPVLFKGGHDAIQFISDLPGHRGGGGLYVLSLYLTPNDHGKDLTLSYRPVTTDIDLDKPENNDAEKSVTIMKDIDVLEFSYYGSKDEKIPPIWSDEWRVKKKLPELVRMHIEPVRADNYIPDMVVNLHTGNVRGQPQLILYKGEANRNNGTNPNDTGTQPDTDRADITLQAGSGNG